MQRVNQRVNVDHLQMVAAQQLLTERRSASSPST